MTKPYRQKTRKGHRAAMDAVLEASGWPLLMCKCGRTIGRYPPDSRIDRTRCLTCIIEAQRDSR